MATKLKVTFEDGKVLQVLASPRAQINTERALQGVTDANAVQVGYRLAFESLMHRRLIASDLGFEEWVDLITDVEEVTDEESEAAEDPTPEAQPPTHSSGSVSTPAFPSAS